MKSTTGDPKSTGGRGGGLELREETPAVATAAFAGSTSSCASDSLLAVGSWSWAASSSVLTTCWLPNAAATLLGQGVRRLALSLRCRSSASRSQASYLC